MPPSTSPSAPSSEPTAGHGPTHRAERRASRLPRVPRLQGRLARRLGRRAGTALVATVVIGLGASVLGVVSPASPSAESGSTVSPQLAPVAAALPSAPLNTFTLNVLHDLPVDQATADMSRAMTLGDAGGFQEMSDEADRLALIGLCNAKDWGWYMPTDASGSIPIVWNRARFRLIDGHSTLVHDAVPGSPSRWINVVRLREVATGKVFGFINTHTISNASFDAQLSDMSKIPLLQKHLQMLRAEILNLFGSTEYVFASGDLNVNYLADQRRQNAGLPTKALGDVVNFDMPNTGSRGEGSLLDYGMTVKDDGGLVKNSSQIVYGFNSDHDAVQFSYTPVDLMSDGALFNDPKGTSVAKRLVIDRENRAISGAEPGAVVRLVTSKLDDSTLTAQLVNAAVRGVYVQVILGQGSATSNENTLTSYLGTNTAAGSWVKRCSGGCLGDAKSTQSNFLLVDRTNGTTNLSMTSSGPFLAKNTTTLGSVYKSSDDGLYAAYNGLFFQFLADAGTPGSSRKVAAGASKELQLYPSTKDPVLKTLGRVQCTKAKGLTVSKGRTVVRAEVSSWSGARGKAIATALGTLAGRGCDVDVLTGKKVQTNIKKMLSGTGVSRRSAAVASNVLVVDGRYGKKNKVSTAWVAGPTWSNGGLTADGTTLVLDDPTSVRSYLDAFARVWKAS